ncbi:site-specific DNA-methyltransferase [Sporolactobacillus sp. STSJ-5]|uniref:DNA-methyltransferase n=1 Tax=Sporolactobacillus sp. STSJ-5 TaxID=2965076 RepID=UPI0021066177|nr:site-specific DNA-methyltransferase [Sporolactobacillus sp. STSJ-5]MCQ2011377.1 site-specific DNA-methyltransferase [Sporolactobacillus sp. STSJ-5]
MGEFIRGECLEEMKKMPDESIDFIFTSPPYADQIKDYGATGAKIKPEQFDNWFIPRAKEMLRILKPIGGFVLNINDKLDGKFQSTFVFKLVVLLVEQVGFHLVRDYIWYNPATPPNVFSRGTMGRTKKSHEYCLWFSKSDTWTFNMDAIRKPYSDRMMNLFRAEPMGDRNANFRPSRHSFDLSHTWKDNGGADPGTVLTISNTSSNDTFHRLCKQFGIGHPARFPEALVDFFVKAGTNEGDVVLDPFAGSGTTAVVAERLGRNFKCIEINPDYCDMAKKWYEVEFSCDDIYKKNMERFCGEMLPKCHWNLLPFGFLYDLYEAWFPTVGLYEKPQSKKAFIERIVSFLGDKGGWSVEDRYLNVDESNMPMPEPLIAKYHLKSWMNKDYQGDNLDNICSPVVQTKYKGILRET